LIGAALDSVDLTNAAVETADPPPPPARRGRPR